LRYVYFLRHCAAVRDNIYTKFIFLNCFPIYHLIMHSRPVYLENTRFLHNYVKLDFRNYTKIDFRNISKLDFRKLCEI